MKNVGMGKRAYLFGVGVTMLVCLVCMAWILTRDYGGTSTMMELIRGLAAASNNSIIAETNGSVTICTIPLKDGREIVIRQDFVLSPQSYFSLIAVLTILIVFFAILLYKIAVAKDECGASLAIQLTKARFYLMAVLGVVTFMAAILIVAKSLALLFDFLFQASYYAIDTMAVILIMISLPLAILLIACQPNDKPRIVTRRYTVRRRR